MERHRWVVGFVLAMAVFAVVAASAGARGYASLNQPGPPLSVPSSQLSAALQCEPSVRHAAVEPVLLNPPTGATPTEDYSWNWEPALTKLGIPWCTYTAPNDTLNNIETSGEYLVYAIRTMHAFAGRKIAIMGHSQGGMSMRWPLRFWADTRSMVDDVIGFSGSNHGSTALPAALCSGGCPPADWQQLSGAHFIAALNSRAETFPGISYTEVYTHTDEVVKPNSGPNASAALYSGGGTVTNVATQQVCPGDLGEHLAIGTTDPVAYALAVDALRNPGPADVARVAQGAKSVCLQPYMPGVNPANLNTYLQILMAAPTLGSVLLAPAATLTSGAPVIKAEPTLECYVFASCRGSAAPTLTARFLRRPKRFHAGKLALIRIQVRTREGASLVAVPGVRVSFGGRHGTTGSGGIVTLRLTLKRVGRYRLTATRTGTNRAIRTVRAYR